LMEALFDNSAGMNATASRWKAMVEGNLFESISYTVETSDCNTNLRCCNLFSVCLALEVCASLE
jgi:hypothetical protein